MNLLIGSVLLALHLICMNVASAGPLVCLVLDWRTRGSTWLRKAACHLAWSSTWLLAVGGVLGLALGWLRWTPEYADVVAKFPSKVFFGVWEFVFSLVLTAAAAVWLSRDNRGSAGGRVGRSLLLLLSGTNLLYHFPFLLVIMADVASGRSEVLEPVDASAFRGLMANSLVQARVLHFWIASFAVCGAGLMFYEFRSPAGESDNCSGPAPGTSGARLALATTIIQFPAGIWLLVSLPASTQQSLMGRDPLGLLLLLGSLTATLWLLHQLSVLSFAALPNSSVPDDEAALPSDDEVEDPLRSWTGRRRSIRMALVALLIVVGLMSGLLHRINTWEVAQ